MIRADGKRQMSVAFNLIRWNKLDSSGKPQHHPISVNFNLGGRFQPKISAQELSTFREF